MIKEHLYNLRDHLEERFDISVYTDNLNKTDVKISSVIFLSDSDSWSGDEKNRSFNITVSLKYALSQFDSDFTEIDAQDHAYDIWQYLITSTIVGMRFIHRGVQSAYDGKNNFIIELNFTSTFNA